MIEIQHLSFSYNKREPIIQDVSLQVPKGSVYGFLGPNGSGKTTIIRLVLNLIKANSGTIKVDGEEITRNSVSIYRKIGSMIESPALYNHLTGLENLDIFARYYQVGQARIQEVLKIVGLEDAASKTVKRYSLGMKQRLSIGICLLHDPELLILDEPLNGLDPHGIAEIRQLLIRLSREEGKTVFVSSHLLSEIENTCDYIGIISRGKLLFEGKIADFKGDKNGKLAYRLELDRPADALAFLRTNIKQIQVLQKEDHLWLEFDQKSDVPLVLRQLVEQGFEVSNYQKTQQNLEDLFLELTK